MNKKPILKLMTKRSFIKVMEAGKYKDVKPEVLEVLEGAKLTDLIAFKLVEADSKESLICYECFKKLLERLGSHLGRHTGLVTVLVPEGYDLNPIMNQLELEYGMAESIKSKNTRQNVTTALGKVMQQLALFKKTPEHGLALFAGNVGDEQNNEWVVESIIPPEPLQTRAYRCDQEFYLGPLEKMLETQPKKAESSEGKGEQDGR